MTPEHMTLPTGPEIRQARLDRGLTLKRLGELAGVHYITIMHYENGKKPMSPPTLAKVVSAIKAAPPVELDARREEKPEV